MCVVWVSVWVCELGGVGFAHTLLIFGAAAGACRQSAKHQAGGGSRGLREEGQRRMRGEQDCGGAGESTCGTMRGSTVAVLHGKGGGSTGAARPPAVRPPARLRLAAASPPAAHAALLGLQVEQKRGREEAAENGA